MTAISPPIQAILDLFDGPLEEVRFADIDAATLRRLAGEVRTASSELEAQQALLSTLQQALTERQDQLLLLAQRAVAYARVYAENDAELSARLATISLPRAAKRQKAEARATEAALPEADEPAPRGKGNRKSTNAKASSSSASESGAEREEANADAVASDASAEDTATTSANEDVMSPSLQRRNKRRDSARTVTREDVASE
jgi:hypothetical protein